MKKKTLLVLVLSMATLLTACASVTDAHEKKLAAKYDIASAEKEKQAADRGEQAPDQDAANQKEHDEDVAKELEAARRARQEASKPSGDAPNAVAINPWDGTYTNGSITVTIRNGGTEDAYVKVEEEFKSDVEFAFEGDTAYGEHFYNYAMMFGEGYMEMDLSGIPSETRYSITLKKQEGALHYSRTLSMMTEEGPQTGGSVSATLQRKAEDAN